MKHWHRTRLQSPELYCSKIRFLYLAFEASLPVELRDVKTLGLLPPPAKWGAHADERVEPDSPAKWDEFIHSEEFADDEATVLALEKIAERFWTWFAVSTCFGGAAVTGLRESWEREGCEREGKVEGTAEERPNDVDIDLSEGEEGEDDDEGNEPGDDVSPSIETLLGESEGEDGA